MLKSEAQLYILFSMEYNAERVRRTDSRSESHKQKGTDMLRIGAHISSAKGYLAMGKTAAQMGANTFQFFTRNPRGVRAKEINPEDVDAFLSYAKEHGISQIMAHAPYTLNACSPTPSLRDLARDTMADDLQRMEYTPGNYYNFHPGSHVGQGVETGITLIANMLNQILKPQLRTTVLLETMSGKGSEVGSRFEELREIIDRVENSDQLGVTLDICHVWDGGYDLAGHPDEVMTEFDRIIGLHRLKAIHLNNSLNPLGAHKDRHALLQDGQIGKEALIRFINHPAVRHLPFYLETPTDEAGHAGEIRFIRESFIKP